MAFEKTDRTIEFDIAFDIMDAAIHRCLSNTVRGFVDFERNEPTRATTIYVLKQYQCGTLGRIRIDKLSNERTELSLFEDLTRPTAEQKSRFRLNIEDPEELCSFEKMKKKCYCDVVNTLLYKLSQESIWNVEEATNKAAGANNTNIYIGGNVEGNVITGNENQILGNSDKKPD